MRVGFLRKTLSRTLSYVFSDRFYGVVFSDAHPAHLAHHRFDTIFGRIRVVSLVFAILTICWIPVDLITLDGQAWMILGGMRLGIAGVFLALAAMPEDDQSHGLVLILLALMLANPLVLFVAAEIVFQGAALTGPAQINANLYAALPFIVMAGLSLFPLVAMEGLLLAVPIFAAVLLMPLFIDSVYWIEVISTSWVLGLLLGIVLLAGMIQVYYMEALLHRANHDPLTGALTRRSGTELIEFSFRLANDKDSPLTVAFLDIDNFKSINDTFGHDAGDVVLRQSVDTLRSQLRDADSIIRWGGEEFVLLLNDTTIDGAHVVIGRITEKWLAKRPDGDPLTASIGVAERTLDGAQTWSELVQLADERMYQAKRTGKARCVYNAAPTVAA